MAEKKNSAVPEIGNSREDGPSSMPRKKCALCGSLETAVSCGERHLLCSPCFRAYSRAFEKLGAGAVVCPEGDCKGTMSQGASDGEKAPRMGPQMLRLKNTETEFEAIAEKFGLTMDRTWIVAVYRIENTPLKNVFELCKARIEKEGRTVKGKSIGANEALLFHASSRAACGGIIREGFDMRRAGQAHGTALGPGAYFGGTAEISHGYSRADARNQRCMFLCRVLLGDTTGRDSKSAAGIYVVNREQQLLPTYFIEYRDPREAPIALKPIRAKTAGQKLGGRALRSSKTKPARSDE